MFPELDPPPGGLARLRERVGLVDGRRARLLALTVVPSLAAAAAAMALVIARAPRPPPPGLAPYDHPSLAEPSATAPAVLAGGARGLAVPIAPDVVLYWVP
ncbi:MAG: hypothetical protein A2138_10575 [Deltaproteobacteria bacterium RBG_16_71_12]|nr:MAG: hypothetical protein A2138_10575 [Deltaproteobacteria bacterium RBG_16_71_12]